MIVARGLQDPLFFHQYLIQLLLHLLLPHFDLQVSRFVLMSFFQSRRFLG